MASLASQWFDTKTQRDQDRGIRTPLSLPMAALVENVDEDNADTLAILPLSYHSTISDKLRRTIWQDINCGQMFPVIPLAVSGELSTLLPRKATVNDYYTILRKLNKAANYNQAKKALEKSYTTVDPLYRHSLVAATHSELVALREHMAKNYPVPVSRTAKLSRPEAIGSEQDITKDIDYHTDMVLLNLHYRKILRARLELDFLPSDLIEETIILGYDLEVMDQDRELFRCLRLFRRISLQLGLMTTTDTTPWSADNYKDLTMWSELMTVAQTILGETVFVAILNNPEDEDKVELARALTEANRIGITRFINSVVTPWSGSVVVDKGMQLYFEPARFVSNFLPYCRPVINFTPFTY